MRPSRPLALLSCATAVMSFVGIGLGTTPSLAAGAVFGNGDPGFVVSAAPAGSAHLSPLLTADPDFAGEPSVGVDWKTGAGMYMAGTNTFRLGLNGSQVTWTDASPAAGLSQNLDPISATDPRSGVTIAGGDTGACSAMYASSDDGATWLPSLPCTVTTDHPTVGYAPSATTPGGTVWYYCQQEVLDNCATSTTAGTAWVPGANFNTDCLSLHGHLRGGPDGTAYLPNVDCTDAASGETRVGGLRTQDDGLTWSTYTIPGAPMPASGFDPGVTVDAGNTVYEGWNNAGDYHPMIAWSHDKGATWSSHVDLASTVSPPLVASTFPTLVSGDAGRVAYTFLGTSAGAPGVDPFATGFHGIWYAYTSFTYDGGQTWTTVRDTPTPLQYGEIDAGGTTTTGQRNLLDFIDSSVTKDGRVLVALADGCLADCEAAGASGSQSSAEALSTHAYATVAYQTVGRGLFAANDVVLAPSAPALTATGTSSGVDLAWTAPVSDGGAPVTQYRVYRSSGSSTPGLVGSASTLAFRDTSAVRGTSYSYTVTAVNSAGESPASNSAAASAFTVPSAPTLRITASGSDAQLSFSSADNGGAAITGYRVLRGTASGAESPLTTTTATTLTDTGLSVGRTYFYKVVATNAAGDSPASPEVSFSNGTPAGPPTLSATVGKLQVRLAWTVPSDGGSPITGYQIYRGTSSGSEAVVQTISSGTSYVDTAVTRGTRYFYKVAAVTAAGSGALSNEVTAAPK